jgi:uncharacterized protein
MMILNIVDRRLNPKGKSLANRQRFLKRTRVQIQRAVRDALINRKVTDVVGQEQISIPMDGLNEPVFQRGRSGGVRDHVLPGNRDYMVGDHIPRPEDGEGGESGNQGSDNGNGDDDFRFILSRDEFLDVFLEDLELPDLIKTNLAKTESHTYSRAGYSTSGSPSAIALVRTMRNSLSRRIALKRPKPEDLRALEAEIRQLEESGDDPERLSELRVQFDRMAARNRRVPYIDPLDVRYSRFECVPKPVTQAVMFCLMDVSGSMSEHMKDLAKRFFMLLYLFLTKRYGQVDIVFIRHTHEAREVGEDEFFHSTETGGTVVSTALIEMKKIIDDRYPPSDWNIYAAQASDGDNTSSDHDPTINLLQNALLPVTQYFAYIEVGAEYKDWLGRETDLWRCYKSLMPKVKNLAMSKVKTAAQIFPVFRDLFARDKQVAYHE